MSFSGKTFVDQVKAKIAELHDGADWLIDAYAWASRNLRAIRKHWPKYEQRWLQREILNAINIDPAMYFRVASKLGGGARTIEALKSGRKIIRRAGYQECLLAERNLTNRQLLELAKYLPANYGPDEFRAIVEEQSAALKGESESKPTGTLDYRKEYVRLLEENARLKGRIEELEALLNKYKLVPVG